MLPSEAMENRRPIRHCWGELLAMGVGTSLDEGDSLGASDSLGDGNALGDGGSVSDWSVFFAVWCRALWDDFFGVFGEAAEVHAMTSKTNV